MATEAAPALNGTFETVLANGSGPDKTSPGTPSVDQAIALSPCDLEAVPTILGETLSNALKYSNGSFKDDRVRLELLENARSLVRALETPRETMIKHTWAQVRRH
jgi:two-component sensor histidine kinase